MLIFFFDLLFLFIVNSEKFHDLGQESFFVKGASFDMICKL